MWHAPFQRTMTDIVFQPRHFHPTDEQRAIQLERRRHVVIEANAGAAKTTTLALRLAQALARGADPHRILALTYTEAAVVALQQALAHLGVPAATRHALRIETFDAFCRDCLQRIEGPGVTWMPSPELLKPHVLLAIERVLDNPDERHRDEFAVQGSGEGSVEGLLAAFHHLKGTLLLTLEAADQRMTPSLAQSLGHDYLTLRVFSRYEQLRRGGHPDRYAFRAPHDATHDLARMLLTDDDGLSADPHPLAQGLNLVLVDEMHDTNRAMFTVLQHLLQRNPAAFVGVGDRDQVIHAVSGADARFMGEWFDQEIAVPHRPRLSATWRFGPQLARLVARLAGKSCQAGDTTDTTVQCLALDEPETSWHVLECVPGRAGARHVAASRPAELAVLLRHPHQSVMLETLLLSKGVSYRTLGFDTFLARPEILLIRALMAHAFDQLADTVQPEHRVRMLEALLLFTGAHVDTGSDDLPGSPAHRQLTQQALQEVSQHPHMLRLFMDNQVLRNADRRVRQHVHDTLALIETGRIDALRQGLSQALAPRWLAARVMVRAQDIDQVSRHLDSLMQAALQFDDLPSLMRGLNRFEHLHRGQRQADGLLLATIEASKGLEFEHVIMPGLNRGEFGAGALHSDNRNLFYVGMTRARRALTLIHHPERPTRFLQDAGILA